MAPLVLHEFADSGNCYKIRLTAALLGIPLARRQYDITRGETRTPAFLAINPDGRIPVLQVGDRYLPESNAACLFLADGSDLVPADRFDRADMLRWLFWEQYAHEPNVATLRFWRKYVSDPSPVQVAAEPGKRAAGEAALALMDRHLATHEWLATDRFTLADVALHAYTHVADEGGFDLDAYPAIGGWLARVAARPRFVAMDA